MKDKIKHFLAGGLTAVCVVCIAAFAALVIYLNRQSDQAVTQLGRI